MPAFVTNLLRNAPFLVVVLPLLGAVLVGTSATLGTLAARRTAQANALITSFVVLAMAAYFVLEHGGESPMPARVLPWLELAEPVGEQNERGDVPTELRGPPVRLAFAVDGLNLGFAVVLCLTMFAVLRVGPEAGEPGPSFYALVLVWQACLLGAFLADDLLVFAVFSEASILPAFLVIGGWGGLERRAAASRWLVVRTLSGAFVVFGLAGLVVVARWTTGLGPRGPLSATSSVATGLVAAASESWAAVWTTLGPWIVGALVLGLMLRAAVIPLHTWLVPVSVDTPAAGNLLLLAGTVNVGLYGLLRFATPFAEGTGWLVPVCVAGTVFGSLLVLAQGNLLKLIACATLVHVAGCAAGVFAGTASGATGAVLYALHHAAAIGLLAYVVGRLNDRFGTADVEAYGGLARRCPRLAVLLFVAVIAVVGAPFTSGFVSRWLLFDAAFARSATLAVWLGIGTLVLAWGGLWTLHRLLAGRPRLPIVVGREPPAEVDLDWGETLAAVPLVLVVLGLGCVPGPVVDVTSAALPFEASSTSSANADSIPAPVGGGG